MNKDTNSLPIEASQDEGFVEIYDRLLKHLFLSKQNGTEITEISIPPQKIQRATWLASIIALSNSEPLKNLANSFGALLYLYSPNNTAYQRACYVLQSRSGNLLSSQHIPNIFKNGQYESSFGTLLDLELGSTRGRLTHKLESAGEFVFTDYQTKLWAAIQNGSNVAISAPTSAGKSFIIRRYIVEKLRAAPQTAVFVVPTKALINQVSMDFKSDLKHHAHVYTTYRKPENYDKSIIFVLTPERCNKLLQDKTLREPTIIFIDEIHNLETDGRGMVFENCLYGLVARFARSQFIFAGPFIEDIVTPLKELSGLELVDETTVSTPVFQVKAAITFIPGSRSAQYRIFSQTGNVITGETILNKKLYSKAKSRKGVAIATFLQNFKKKESCIIFAPRKSTAENWALHLLPTINSEENKNIPDAVSELIEFLSEEIHPEYSLIRTLKKGVAFHHAGLPDIARIEIEDLYSKSEITNLVCTSTLLQGVNLPADKLIVISPHNDNTPLTPFEFMNLIGRAGRISTNLYGEVYCLEVKDEEWGLNRLANNEKTKIKPNTTSILQHHTDKVIEFSTANRETIMADTTGEKLYSMICYLRHLFISDKTHFDRIMDTANINGDQRGRLETKLSQIKQRLTIPVELLQQNPYVDPILQEKLYRIIKQDPLSWIPTSPPLQRRKSNSAVEDPKFTDLNFYAQFKSITLRLDEIFSIEAEINSSKYNEYISVRALVYDAYQWMAGNSHRKFIDNYLRYLKNKKNNEEADEDAEEDSKKHSVDKAARFVTRNISTNITFKLVKYFSLWSDITRACLTEREQEKFAYALSLPSMIELGSFDPKVLELMSLGINRSIALKLRKLLPHNIDNLEVWLRKFNSNRLSPLLRRYLERSGLTREKALEN